MTPGKCHARWRTILGTLLAAMGIGLVAVGNCSAADVQFYSVLKGEYYMQTNNGPPVLRPFRPYFFRASVLGASNNSLTMATYNLPSGITRPVFPSSIIGPYLGRLYQWQERPSSKSSLDSNYRNGTYTFNLMTRNDGTKNTTLNLAGDQYPSVPRLTNWPDAQHIDPQADFELGWEPMSGGTTNDFIELIIHNSTGIVFRTGFWLGESNALSGTATGVRIPAKTLQPSRLYLGKLLFQKTVSTATNYAFGNGGYARQTDFYLATVGAETETPPDVIRFFPPDGAANVPVNVQVAVEFDRPMGPGFNVAMIGTTNSVQHRFSADKRTCYVFSSYPWPAGQTVTFCFNSLDGMLSFGDSNGNVMLPDRTVRLSFSSSTLPTNAVSPVFASPALISGQTLKLTFMGEAFRGYCLQISTNLVDWQDYATIYSTTNPISISQPIDRTGGCNFFRVVARPLE